MTAREPVQLTPAFVQYIPEASQLTPGVLYVSMEYETTIHLCPCGCGNEVVVPFGTLGAGKWELTRDGDAVTLNPSIGNYQFPCRSHYWIRGNEVQWA